MKFFTLLLALFPKSFRDAFGGDMRDVFVDQLAAARRRSRWAAVPALWLRTAVRMPIAAWREHRMMDLVRQDLRFTARALLRAPVFTLVTISVVAVGIGAVATIFSALNALVLRPLPGATNGDALFTIDRRTPDYAEGVSLSGALFEHLRTSTKTLSGAAVWSRVALSITADGRNLAVPGSIVSKNYFDVLGLRPAAGRFFTDGDSADTVVISHRLWVQHFAEAPNVHGRTVTLNGRPYTVIGVAPEAFRGVFTPLRIDAWVPLQAQPHVRPGRDLAHAPWLWFFGRVHDGVPVDTARAELTTLVGAWAASPGADAFARYTAVRFTPLTGLPDDARKELLAFGGVLLGAALLVLIVAGANVSSLLAMRATARRQEMGLRTALGAGRVQLVRQLLTETLLLFMAGAGGGVMVAWMATSALERLPLPGDSGLMLELSPDVRVVVVAALMGLAAGMVFGLGPALRGTAHSPALLIRSATAGSGHRRSRLTSALLVGQLAASLVLLSVTALFIQALARGATIDPGFVATDVTTAALNTESYGYTPERGRDFYERLTARIAALQGVTHVAFGHGAPLVVVPDGGTVTVPRADGGERVNVRQTLVGPGFFDALGIPIRHGRSFDDRDTADTPAVAIVNETFGRQVWPGVTDIVGRTFDRGTTRMTIIGVAADAKFSTLDEPARPFVYVPITQRWQPNLTMFVKAVPGTTRLDAAIVDAVRALDPAVPAPVVTLLADDIGIALFPQRVAAAITSVLGGGALLLACAGLYGAITYLVTARTREIGVRMALGATRTDVLRLFVHDGLRLTAAAVGIGLAGSIGAAQVVAGFLLGGESFDLTAFGLAAGTLLLVASAATIMPARRAAHLDPVVALRN